MSRLPTRTRSMVIKREPLCIYKALLTSMVTSDDDRKMIYVNPLNSDGFMRTDNGDINNWFKLDRNTHLRTFQYSSKDVKPVIIFRPIEGENKFEVVATLPDDKGNEHGRVVERITAENLMGVVKSLKDSRFEMYTDYDTISLD